ncbi:hypothetical protein Ancab_026691 [Ancistrocladus abbreviatus]
MQEQMEKCCEETRARDNHRPSNQWVPASGTLRDRKSDVEVARSEWSAFLSPSSFKVRYGVEDLRSWKGNDMEANGCDINHPETDVLLPPRKRLLAGLKKQNSETRCSQENSNSSPLSGFDSRLNNLLKSHKNGSKMSPQEIAEAAGSAAVAAARTAKAARAAAEEKAAIAAKAVAAAKTALDLVASVSEEIGSSDRHQKKNKLKKQVPVQLLYKKYQPVENSRTDEELARRLHRAINSSPRILKHSPGSDTKNHKHKKLKISPINDKVRFANGITLKEGNCPAGESGDEIGGEMDSKGSNEESYIVKLDDKASKSSTFDQVEINNREAESSQIKERNFDPSDDTITNGRKRGRIKQKKLPLSLCSFKDQANPREELNLSSSMSTRVTTEKSTVDDLSLPSVEPPSDGVINIEAAPTWKCQDFKVPQCIKQNKAIQS